MHHHIILNQVTSTQGAGARERILVPKIWDSRELSVPGLPYAVYVGAERYSDFGHICFLWQLMAEVSDNLIGQS
ncbi:hypothetical protein SISSUDRAFT_1055027 [Sistotremastrum suecicum HHB10207 ss-3]|uniref:Uncharacterized protein n=1 Tax=Sistotremastrum suecicum HHB10207 ss-3 TaxID=1314776 RepID=A0A165Y2R5_9AGAM|nr:hypothetical protein SISSUDRAFT_1055027 [Sistotremastrum suecicum HHB10207 ss-3]